MGAFDDFGGAIVTADAPDQLFIRFARVLGDEDVTRASQIPRRLAQGAARQQEFVAERRLSVHQHDVEPMFQMQELHPIVEQKRVHFPFVDRVATAFDAILVDQNDHVFKIVREHVGLVAGGDRIEKHGFSVGHDAWRIDIFGQQSIEPISFCRLRHAFVTAAQDGDAPTAGLQRPREFFHHRRFTRSADREIPDANNKAAERALAENSFPIQIKPELNDALVKEGQEVKNSAQNGLAKPTATPEHDVDSELLQIFKRATHLNF